MRYSLLLPFALLASPALAQTSPSITAADMPVVGDSLRLSQASPALPASAPPLSRNGANQTWNYAGLVATAQRVVRYNNVSTAAGTLLQLTFNNAFFSPDTRATLVSPQGLPAAAGTLPVTDPLEFSAVSSADYRLVGYGGTISGTAVPVTYASRAQQDVIYRFPISYGNAADVSNSLLTTPVALASNGYFSQKRQRTNQPDAWGTLTTPFGTFQAVRVVTTLADHDSIALGGAPGQGLTLPLVREYKWLAKGVHVPVLTITTTAVAGSEVIASVEYRDVFRRFVGLAARDAATDAVLGAYPNPSAVGTGLRLVVPAGSGPLTVSGTDLLGRQLFTKAYPSSPGGVLVLDAGTFGSFRGVLLLTVTTARGTATRRVVRQ
ncbi:T9SS type A sorting domain-containing protein [Hymenobacter cheonanensis]|uniref:T9SS type A sorting domain-containing protein n=1 Tax=Hymenobacter sp. CA2-7 TaxID=3063993 RepID=UPI002712BA85|nr:T9SS type A sorting domain-containing protein [Hymenobacter sp. CA2-7]MDO7887352.1 T9SS type A sorting domain-containing protein [Hymenobacter sp. CA2-7]